jgi:hypothetical protein
MMAKNLRGRPTLYTQDLADEICKKISTTSKGLLRLCNENSHWPTKETILDWRLTNKNDFSYQYRNAKAAQVEALVDECLDISDDTSYDSYIQDNGKEVCNSEYVNRSRLRVDTRKWIASKLAPKVYGDKLDQTIQANVNQMEPEDWTDKLNGKK